MLPRSRTRTAIGALLVAGLASLALAGSAAAAVTVSQVESADPVEEGGQVTYTMTVANSGAAVEGIVLDVVATKPTDASPVENPYLSLTASQGSCALGAGSFTGGRCSLGTLGAGAGATVTAVVEANFSMRNVATLAACDSTGEFCFPVDGGTSSEETTVTHPPSLAGSKKIKIKGLPAACASSTFKAKAKVKAPSVRSVTASISGPRDEFDDALDGFEPPQRLGKKKGRKLKAKVKAGTLPDGYYELTFLAQRKGKPNLKRTATFGVC
jgi:hypothetical protein